MFELFLASFELLNALTLEVVLGFGTALHTSRLTLNRLRPAAVALLFRLVLCLRVMKMGANGEKNHNCDSVKWNFVDKIRIQLSQRKCFLKCR